MSRNDRSGEKARRDPREGAAAHHLVHLKVIVADAHRSAGIPISVVAEVSSGTSFLPAQKRIDSSRTLANADDGIPTAQASLILCNLYSSVPTNENLAAEHPDTKTVTAAMIVSVKLCLLFTISPRN